VKSQRKNAQRGFTLIELMVAMAITTIIVTILISITSISLDTWNRSRSEVRAARQAQAMTEILARDFEAMVVRPGNNFEWLIAESADSVGSVSNQSPSSVDLILFTAATDRYDGVIGGDADMGGDISTIGYALRFKDPIGAGGGTSEFPTFVLYRKLVNPDDTFRDLLGQQDLKAAFVPYENDIEDMANFVCENIYQFTVSFHLVDLLKQSGAGPAEMEPGPVSVTLNQDFSSFKLAGDGIEANIPASAFPADVRLGPSTRIDAVEISITVLSDNALTAIRGNAVVSDDFIRKNSYQYSKRIEVPRP
jgi:prepilin-type N-terminal cleavage/methylation domain-containing protein